MIRQYDDEIASVESAPRPPSEVVDLDAAVGRSRRGLNWSNVLVASLVVVVGYAGFSVLRPGGDGGDTAPTGNAAPAAVSDVPSPGATPTPTGAAPSATPSRKPPVVAANPEAGVRVVVAATEGQCWLRATGAGGKRLFEGIVAKGSSRQFTDTEVVSLLVGDAGAVSLTVNGKQIGAPGARGEIARAQFTPEDP
nr:RodZ domain-containing protein [Motilibacter deserti]